MNVVNLFVENAQKYPDKMAIIEQGQSITYGRLSREVSDTAAYFKMKGIGKGDRVLVFVPMSIDLYRVVIALFHIGATAVFLDAWVNKSRMELCCKIAGCKGFIGVWKAKVFSFFSKELRKIPIKLSLKNNVIKSNVKPLEVENDHPALITFTTGSTGTPKAALRSHDFLTEQFDALLEEINPQPNDVAMSVLPIVLFVNLGVGCTSVIADFKMSKPDSLKVDKIIKQIETNQINRIIASPFFIKKLSGYLIQNKQTLSSIQQLFTGGAAVFPAEAAIYKAAFPNTKSVIAYGSTEAEPISSITVDELLGKADLLEKGLPVGAVFPRAEVRIIKQLDQAMPNVSPHDFELLTLPDTKIGEIVVSGPHVLKKYFNNEKAFKENKIISGDRIWHRTGDSGFLEGNQLFLTGRCKQLIKYNGQYLAPFIIENKLQQLEGIEMGTMIKKLDKIHLVIASSLTKKQLEKRILALELPYDKLIVLDKMPVDPRHRSKIDYEALGSMIM